MVRVTQILARRHKNNPLLLGEPGVGKTAIAEGLAEAIVTRTNADGTPLPAFLHNKRVMQLDVGLLIAGAKVRGGAGAGELWQEGALGRTVWGGRIGDAESWGGPSSREGEAVLLRAGGRREVLRAALQPALGQQSSEPQPLAAP